MGIENIPGGTQDLLASNAQAGTGEAGKEKEGLGLQSENLLTGKLLTIIVQAAVE